MGAAAHCESALFVILGSDGSAQIVGEGEVCEEERRRNGSRCFELGLSGATIAIAGDISDWDAVAQSASVSDPSGDYMGSDPGADLRTLKVEYGDNAIFVLMRMHAPLSTQYQARMERNAGVYRLTVQGDNGLSLSERLAYSPEAEAWMTVGGTTEITAAAGSDGGTGHRALQLSGANGVAERICDWVSELEIIEVSRDAGGQVDRSPARGRTLFRPPAATGFRFKASAESAVRSKIGRWVPTGGR